jgi:hypothetical protein
MVEAGAGGGAAAGAVSGVFEQAASEISEASITDEAIEAALSLFMQGDPWGLTENSE